MKGYINNILLNEYGYEHGFITGEDGESYSFDGRSLLGKHRMEECTFDDEVEFTPLEKREGRIYPRASKVEILRLKKMEDDTEPSQTVQKQSQVIDFFTPGFSRHMNKKDTYNQFLKNEIERKTVNELSNVLFVSRIGHHIIDQRSKFEFCIVGATDMLKQFVRGRVEFLIVFSYFDSQIWQAKSLIVERELRKRREIADRRPVVNFYVLVSNAMTLFQEVDKIKGSTNAAVIPFTFDEICDSTSNKDLREIFAKRFQQYLYENNMLGDTEAIEDDNLLFGDRGKIADLIVDRCQKRANSGIFGLRRSGKTSVLNASLRRLDKAGIKYIKIESRSELENLESWKTALFDIAKKIRCRCLSLDQQDNENREEFSRRLKLNSTESDYEKRPTACFVEDVKLYCRDEESFVIAIDEIELITFNTAKTDTWKSIEAYCGFWGALRDCGCSLIVSGVNSTINELNAIKFNGEVGDNPMYMRIVSCSDFSDTYLPSFTDEQTLYMINTLGGFSNIGFSQVYHDINTAFGGQPYAIRQFCSYVFEKVKKYRKINEKYEVSEATISNLLNEFQESAEGKRLCEIILQHLTIFADEYDMLKKLALLPERNRIVDFSDVERIDHLQKYGLIYYDPVTKYISFRLNTIYTYIRRQYSKSPSEMNNDERREYIQSKVAEYEKKLKTFICNYFIYNSGGDIKCRNIMKTYINSSARNKAVSVNQKADTHSDPNTCNIRDFFDHKKYIIYFSSLRKIIIDNWNLWGARFESVDIDKVKFDLYMKQLNAGRTDADHYDAEELSFRPKQWDISDDIMSEFENASKHLDRFFEALS